MLLSGGIVALGKFDALHIGHRELAIQASKVGVPFLLSFIGMAEVLGWEPRYLLFIISLFMIVERIGTQIHCTYASEFCLYIYIKTYI